MKHQLAHFFYSLFIQIAAEVAAAIGEDIHAWPLFPKIEGNVTGHPFCALC